METVKRTGIGHQTRALGLEDLPDGNGGAKLGHGSAAMLAVRAV